jgi:CRISPR-associated protein Csm3
MVLDVLCEEDKPLLARVAEGLRLLEDDALGGGGSRGSGRVNFTGLTLIWRSKDYYAKDALENNLLSDAGLPALQQLASAEDFPEKLA